MKEHIIINSDRTVTVPDSAKKIAVQYDHNVNTLIFNCPRYADEEHNIDLSTMQIFVNYMRPDKTMDSSICEDIAVDDADDSIIHFKWTITSGVTSVAGVLSCLVCFKQTDSEGIETYHWNTELFQRLTISGGMECDVAIEEENADLITQLLTKMNAAEIAVDKAKNSADEAKQASDRATSTANDVAEDAAYIRSVASDLLSLNEQLQNVLDGGNS